MNVTRQRQLLSTLNLRYGHCMERNEIRVHTGPGDASPEQATFRLRLRRQFRSIRVGTAVDRSFDVGTLSDLQSN
jgi:hypothetical protein